MALLVTPKAMRPASPKLACFYCHAAVGGLHAADCVLVVKKVRVRMIVEYEVEEPAAWSKDAIEFRRNEGSWCADNAITELERLAEAHGCLCSAGVRFECLGDASEPYVGET